MSPRRPAAGGGIQDPRAGLTLLELLIVMSLLALVLGILSMSGEYRHQTITSTLLGTPRRGNLLVGKLAALAIVVALIAASGDTTTLLGIERAYAFIAVCYVLSAISVVVTFPAGSARDRAAAVAARADRMPTG